MTGETPPEPRVDERSGQWEDLPPDPDLAADLEYEMLDLEVIRAKNGSGQFMFIPRDEDMIHENAFVVAEPAAVCDVLDCL